MLAARAAGDLVVGVGYIVVGVYVAWDTLASILGGHRPDASRVGIVFLAGTVTVMIVLGVSKLRTGRALDSPTVEADGRFSLIDGALAGAVLTGLLLTAVLGWWWSDAVLAGLIALFIALATVSLQAYRAAARNPVDALRYE